APSPAQEGTACVGQEATSGRARKPVYDSCSVYGVLEDSTGSDSELFPKRPRIAKGTLKAAETEGPIRTQPLTIVACVPTNRSRWQPSSDGSRSTLDHQTASHLLRISTNAIEGSTDVTMCILPRMDLCSAL